MMINDNLNLSYDLSGNLVLTIPKLYIQNIEQEALLKAVEKLIKSETEQMQTSHSWDGDPAADVTGICSSETNNGSVHHDRDIYGL